MQVAIGPTDRRAGTLMLLVLVVGGATGSVVNLARYRYDLVDSKLLITCNRGIFASYFWVHNKKTNLIVYL